MGWFGYEDSIGQPDRPGYRGPAGGGGGGEALYGLVEIPASPSGVGQSGKYGWEFTVGASNIEVSALRVYIGGSNDSELLQLYSGDLSTILASVTVSALVNEWVEGEVSPVMLLAGQNYIVTHYRGTSRTRYAPLATSVTFSERLSFVQGRRVSSNNNPTFTDSGQISGLADIRFTV